MSNHSGKKSELTNPKLRYINRELSWLAFNTRVLEEAMNPQNPILERVKFLSISASNLDEFYMVRVAGIKDQIRHGLAKQSDDGLSPEQQMKRIHQRAHALMQQQQECWLGLRKELKHQGVMVARPDDLPEEDQFWLKDYFFENIFPVLTPIAIDPAHPFPFLPNLGLAYVFKLSSGKKKKKDEQIAVLPFPPKLQRFVQLPGKGTRFVLAEDIITRHLESLFPGFTLDASGMFRIVRDSDLDIEEEAEDLVRHFERAVKMRRRGRVIRIKVLRPMAEDLLHFVMAQLKISADDVIEVDAMLGLASLFELYDTPRADLKYPPYEVRFPERISDYNGDCFAAIQAKDIVVHHPFESFDVVVQFLRQAAEDPNVISIKQTLYRTSKDSPIVRALIEAAESGKSVTALVELKARFDEEANIKWARDMERAGVQVIFGFVNLKTHAKISLVTRRVGEKLVSYVHFGTGNYHPATAKVYTDLSFFTCDAGLTRDTVYFFNYLTGYAPPRELRKLIVAPLTMRGSLSALIDQEIAHAKAGRPASIWAKMNALVDTQMIDRLYEASGAGVKINLIVRGVCCLRPGVPGLSENIAVKSVIGRFLEHSRIFCFGAGHPMPSLQAKVFISSADWMPRNFDWRLEAMVPIENPTVHEQILSQIMVAYLKDDQQSWKLMPEGDYKRLPYSKKGFSAHEYFMHNPSLSGRGKALTGKKKKGARKYTKKGK